MALLALFVWLFLRAIHFNRAELPVMMRRWREAFLCQSCGHLFRP
jgi:hypothetical protein